MGNRLSAVSGVAAICATYYALHNQNWMHTIQCTSLLMCIAVKCLEEWSSTPTALIASSCKQASLKSNQNGHNLVLMQRPQHSGRASVFWKCIWYLSQNTLRSHLNVAGTIFGRATLSDKVEVGQNLPPPHTPPRPLCRDDREGDNTDRDAKAIWIEQMQSWPLKK